jgi:hypothetical protein
MKRIDPYMRVFAAPACLVLLAALVACNKSSTSVNSSAPATHASTPNLTDATRLSDGATKLMDAMDKPTKSFHFSFKGEENINMKYQQDKTQAPKVGPVALLAEISPEEISLTETRGSTTTTSKAKKGDDMSWAMANLTTLGVMTSPNFAIAVGSSVTSSPVTDLVGAIPADKFTFDTKAANPSQKVGLDAARSILTTIKDCKGTAWIAKDSGLLIKFNIDTDYVDKNNHAWTEHYEGEVTP